MSYTKNQRDANEPVLLEAAAKMGCTWVEAPPLDGWIGLRGQWVPVEIKLPKRKGHKDEFRPSQKKFMALCDANRLPYWVWRETNDVQHSVEVSQ